MKCLAFNIGPDPAQPTKIRWVVIHPIFGNCLCTINPGDDVSKLAAAVNAYIAAATIVDIPTLNEGNAVGVTVKGTFDLMQNGAGAIGPLPTNTSNVPLT
jgi:hypothetical protein